MCGRTQIIPVRPSLRLSCIQRAAPPMSSLWKRFQARPAQREARHVVLLHHSTLPPSQDRTALTRILAVVLCSFHFFLWPLFIATRRNADTSKTVIFNLSHPSSFKRRNRSLCWCETFTGHLTCGTNGFSLSRIYWQESMTVRLTLTQIPMLSFFIDIFVLFPQPEIPKCVGQRFGEYSTQQPIRGEPQHFAGALPDE